jgi:hypothetical protein
MVAILQKTLRASPDRETVYRLDIITKGKKLIYHSKARNLMFTINAKREEVLLLKFAILSNLQGLK